MKALCRLPILLLIPYFALAAGTVLESETESQLTNTICPPSGLLRVILDSETTRAEADLFRECLRENGLSISEAEKLFSVAAVPLQNQRESLYFVRPRLEPYCMAFYGAHTFRYWLVSSHLVNNKNKYRIIYEGNSDSIAILSSSSKGYPDIEVGASRVVEFVTSLWKYDGKRYVRTSSRTER